jgi:MtN3 and saliva related transmembrane protein
MGKIDLIGFAAGLCTTFSLLPQLRKMVHSRCAKDLSMGEYVIYAFGVFLWLIYGIALHEAPLIVWNGTGLAFACLVIALKIRYDRRHGPTDPPEPTANPR